MRKIDTAESRYRLARVMAHGGWWGSLVLLVVHISMGGRPPTGSAPSWLSLVVVLLIGVGIAGGQALGRMRLTESIKRAFEVGYQVKSGEQLDDVADRQNQILEELEDARHDRNRLVRDLQKEIATHDHESAR